MLYCEPGTRQGLVTIRPGRQPVKSDCPSTNLWDYVYAPRVRGGFANLMQCVYPTGAGRVSGLVWDFCIYGGINDTISVNANAITG